MRNFLIVVKADLSNLIGNPMWIFYATAFPICLVAILGYLTKELYGTTITSFDYYGITLMLYSIISSGLTASNAFLELKIKRPNMRILYALSHESTLYLSKIVSSFLFCYAFHMADMVLLCAIFHIHVKGIPLLVLFSGCIELCSVTLGIMMCCLFKTEEMSNQILGIVLNLIAIFGGLLFSLDGYGVILRTITRISPAKWLADAVFQVIYDQDYHLVVPCIIGMGILMALMLGICKVSFRKEDYIC